MTTFLGILALIAALFGAIGCFVEVTKKEKVYRIMECAFFLLLGINDLFLK